MQISDMAIGAAINNYDSRGIIEIKENTVDVYDFDSVILLIGQYMALMHHFLKLTQI